jgi:hypothetical protein
MNITTIRATRSAFEQYVKAALDALVEGALDDESTAHLALDLIDTGYVWRLESPYREIAYALIVSVEDEEGEQAA